MEHAEAYWDLLDGESPLYRAEGRDYVRRLLAAVDVGSSARVLDFGCGFGFVALELSSHVREVCLWDGSPRMRALAAENIARSARARVLEAPPWEERGLGPFDLVVLNSVLQYVDDQAARRMLVDLRAVLTASGCIVVSDVITPESKLPRELAQLLRFAVGRGLIGALMREGARIGGRYADLRRRSPSPRTREDLRRLAASASLVTEFLPANLTCRRRRLAAVLRPAASFSTRDSTARGSETMLDPCTTRSFGR